MFLTWAHSSEGDHWEFFWCGPFKNYAMPGSGGMVSFATNFYGRGGHSSFIMQLGLLQNIYVPATTSKLSLKSNADCVCMCLPLL